MSTLYRCYAVLGVDRHNPPHLLGRAKGILNGLTANPVLFANPNPPLATLQGKIQALDAAQQAASTRAKGTAAARDVKAAELVTSLETARTYVQGLADENGEQGPAIIEAASMTLRQAKTYSKPILQAKQIPPSSVVHLIANVGMLTASTSGKVYFNWQSSADGGKTWNTLPVTLHGRTKVSDLTPNETYAFRVSVTDSKGPGEWSQAVTLLVR